MSNNKGKQLDMLMEADTRSPIEKVETPQEIEELLFKADTTLLLNLSGGKDGLVMARLLSRLHRQNNWQCRMVAIHADLGKMEWHESGEECEALAAELGMEYVVVRHPKYDLLDGIEARMEKRPDSPPFPSAAARYCTSDWKRSQISKWIRNNIPNGAACVSAMGLRAQESRARAKKPVWDVRSDANSQRKNRTVLDWNPILQFSLEDVWETIGYTLTELVQWQVRVASWRSHGLKGRALTRKIKAEGFKAHPAYAMGNERVSCAMCVLACAGDLANGAEARPDTYQKLLEIQRRSQYAFQQNKPLEDSVARGNEIVMEAAA